MGTKYNEGEAAGGGGGDATAANQTTILSGIGIDSVGAHSFGFDENDVLGRIDGQHSAIHILFVIPEAVGSINSHNAAIKTILETLGRVDLITQADALNQHAHLREYNGVVLGTNNGTAWTTSNLADIKAVDVPVLCVDDDAGAYLEIGTSGTPPTAQTDIDGVANIEGSVIGIGRHGYTGLAVGANVVATSATFNILNMESVNLSGDVYLAYEDGSVNPDAEVILGIIYAFTADGSRSSDETAADVPHGRSFYGAAYSMDDLNSLGQGVLALVVETMIHYELTGSGSNGVGALANRLLGNMKTSFNVTNPFVEYVCGQDSVGTKLPVGKSLYDMFLRMESIRSFANAGDAKITLTTATTNQVLSDIVVSGIPSGATITRVIARSLKIRALNNTNASTNAVNGATSLKIKKSSGTWGVDDVLLLTIPDNFLSTAASTKEGGLQIPSANVDASSEVDENATYNLRFDGNCFVDGNNLELIDVIVDVEVYFTA